jgi:hypothetical protein
MLNLISRCDDDHSLHWVNLPMAILERRDVRVALVLESRYGVAGDDPRREDGAPLASVFARL